jgi:hypothetical protein
LPTADSHTQATQDVVSRLPETTRAEFNAAVAAAKAAFPAWRETPVPTRMRVMLKFQELIRANWVRRAQHGGAREQHVLCKRRRVTHTHHTRAPSTRAHACACVHNAPHHHNRMSWPSL